MMVGAAPSRPASPPRCPLGAGSVFSPAAPTRAGVGYGGGGLVQAGVSDYDVVVLDRDVPGLHGDDLCRRLRAAGAETRALMLTAAVTTPTGPQASRRRSRIPPAARAAPAHRASTPRPAHGLIGRLCRSVVA